jgi:hypothetical protein
MDIPVHAARDFRVSARKKAKAGETNADDTTAYPQAAETEARYQQGARA